MSDLIDRQAAIDAISCDITVTGRQNAEVVAATIGAFADRIKALPSAQPEYSLDEHCTDCKEYDQERHCCPRWNRVIRRTVEEMKAQQQWISCDVRLPEYKDELVRCRDCVWHDGSICRNNDTMPWSDDDYCSNAERR